MFRIALLEIKRAAPRSLRHDRSIARELVCFRRRYRRDDKRVGDSKVFWGFADGWVGVRVVLSGGGFGFGYI